MATEEKEEDAVYQRTDALFRKLGVSENGYARILEASIVHAVSLPAPAADPAWVPVGPRNLGGRILSFAQHPDVPNTILAGSAHGGVWRSIDRGDTWERLGNAEHVFPVGAMAFAAGTSTRLYVGTGSPLQSYVSGRGLYRVVFDHVNGRADFELLAGVPDEKVPPVQEQFGKAFRYTRIRVDPFDDTRFWVASQTGLWRCDVATAPGSVPGFRRDFPNDKNKPEAAKLLDSFATGIRWPAYATDVLVSADPRESATVQVTRDGRTIDVPRYLILYVAISGKGVWRGRFDRDDQSIDFDSSPLDVPDNSVAAGYTRIRLAQCAQRPENVFAVFATSADNPSEVFRSSNNGKSWTRGRTVIPGTGQAQYDLVLDVSPGDPKVVVCGAVELGLSVDGGDTWQHILDSTQRDRGDEAQHADQHIAMFDVASNRRLWLGNDGGISLANDLRAPTQAVRYWRKRGQGIFAGQFQDITGNPFYPFASGGGLQDNGSWISYGGLSWYYADGGDGGMLAIDHADPHQLFSTWQGTAAGALGIDVANAVPFDQVAAATDSDILQFALPDLPEAIAPGHLMKFRTVDQSPGPNASLFVGIIEQHPTIAGELIAGRIGDAFATPDRGATWTPLLTGLGITAAEQVSAVTFGPIDGAAIPAGTDGWIGTDQGQLFQTAAAARGPWAAAPTALPWPGGTVQSVSRIVVHPNDRRIVAVSSAGSPGRVFISYDRGTTWTDITEPIPTGIAVVGPAGGLQVGHTRRLIANANYADGSSKDISADVAWTTSAAGVATVGTTVIDRGFVLGVGPGAVTITASWTIGVAAPLTATQAINIVVQTNSPPPLPAAPTQVAHRKALPLSPITSLIFDPSRAVGAPQTLLAGTLAGVFALPAVPAVTSLTISPPGPFALQAGAPALQLSCVATYSDGTTRDVTPFVDWSVTGGAGPTVQSAAPTFGQLTAGPNAGAFVVQAARGTVPPATLNLTVQAAAVAPPAIPGVPPGTPPPVPIAWRPFGRQLPLALVSDLARMGTTTRIRASTFGLGVFECDVAAAPQHQLFIRQTVIEDGRSARAIPNIPAAGVQVPTPPPVVVLPAAAPLNDPRIPQAGARPVALDFTHAFDIRLDAPPYTLFDDVVDGVDFDLRAPVNDAVPFEDNYVYVQVSQGGVATTAVVQVHLFAAISPVLAPMGGAAGAGPANGNVAHLLPPPDTANPHAPWRRIGTLPVSLRNVGPGQPVVARFTWVPDETQRNTDVALLAILSTPGGEDPFPAVLPAAASANLAGFVANERRAALRIVHVVDRAPASLFIRDGVADDVRLGGYPVGGRSPDIIVVRPDIAATPADAFKDFSARRLTDTVSATGSNVVYARIHNTRRFQTHAMAKLFAIKLGDDQVTEANVNNWLEAPASPNFAEVDVPPRGVAYARFELTNAVDPNPGGLGKAYLLLVLVQSQDASDLLPTRAIATTADDFWGLVSRFVDADNAAARAVNWVPT
ncbi:MAG: hypothetical protein ACT4P7_15600 [Gemmatimonadaceae bacterium]